MERLKELVDLCKERRLLFDETLFNSYAQENQYKELTKKIKRLASKYDIFTINYYENSTVYIGFNTIEQLTVFTGDEVLSSSYSDNLEMVRYSATFFDGDLKLFVYKKADKEDEEHKNAQAI
ncbi:hypothetical protein MHH70_12380 [Metasolibacillus sp. FSL H7-0170]|uniref:hypothetical protein n=1 Tax=Metasolibacillus sp. FSL H7-0170 TaxID=2921431 RepID=UPI0031580E1A